MQGGHQTVTESPLKNQGELRDVKDGCVEGKVGRPSTFVDLSSQRDEHMLFVH